MAAAVEGAALVHSHTWYAQLGGHLAKLLYGIPHVATVHSLEPLRPWKSEQLGGGYALSSFCERTAVLGADAVVAVSQEMRRDVLGAYPELDPARVHVILNGIDTDEYRPDDRHRRAGAPRDRPGQAQRSSSSVAITRQKGLAHLLAAAPAIDPDAQLILCAGAPDTPELAREIASLTDDVRATRGNLILIEGMLPKRDLMQILSHATVFVCPVDLRAARDRQPRGNGMRRPRSSRRGQAGSRRWSRTASPGSSCRSRWAIRQRVSPHPRLTSPPRSRIASTPFSPIRCSQRESGAAGRARAVESFSWASLAEQTVSLYDTLVTNGGAG